MKKRILRSVSTKLLIIIMMVVLPFTILAIVIGNVAIDAMLEQAHLSVNGILENQAINLDNRMNVSASYLFDVCYQEEGEAFLTAESAENPYLIEKSAFSKIAKENLSLINGADGYFAYVGGVDDVFIWKSTNRYVEHPVETKAAEEKIRTEMKTGWSLEQIDETQVFLYSVKYSSYLQTHLSKYGGWIELETIFDETQEMIGYESTDISVTEEMMYADDKDLITVSVQVDKNIYLNAVIRRSDILAKIMNYYLLVWVGMLAAVALVPGIYFIVHYLLLSPLKVLNHAQKKLQGGDMTYRITEKANSAEFEYVYESFNKMSEQIAFLKIENYEKELDYQKMELSRLQLQIRPHFLLNIFNMIYNLAERHEEEAICNTILYLSDYFRYMFRREKELELFGKEQHLIEGYMQVVEVRYPGSVEIAYEYDPEIGFVRVPPLLLHNFVENIIKHVVKQDVITHITINGMYEDGMVTFRIMDDGPGMPPQKLQELNESMRRKESDGSHVGYYNSMRRLKHFYGEKADITIASELGEGTCVIVSFPYDLEEKGYESFDSE